MNVSDILCLSVWRVYSEEEKMANDEFLEDQMAKIVYFQVTKLPLLMM